MTRLRHFQWLLISGHSDLQEIGDGLEEELSRGRPQFGLFVLRQDEVEVHVQCFGLVDLSKNAFRNLFLISKDLLTNLDVQREISGGGQLTLDFQIADRGLSSSNNA